VGPTATGRENCDESAVIQCMFTVRIFRLIGQRLPLAYIGMKLLIAFIDSMFYTSCMFQSDSFLEMFINDTRCDSVEPVGYRSC